MHRERIVKVHLERKSAFLLWWSGYRGKGYFYHAKQEEEEQNNDKVCLRSKLHHELDR